MVLGVLLTVAVYGPGLSGGWIFDDFPNIVDNPGVHPSSSDLPSLINALLSSPSSDFKRPLASLSFAINFLIAGLDPYPMKVTNLVIHLINGLLLFLLLRAVVRTDYRRGQPGADRLAALIATTWMLLPINLTAVLYVVQRMESMANLFVLLGLLAYVHGRLRMLAGRTGLALCVAGVLLGTGIGMLAKETAVMLPVYAFLSEVFLFQWRRHENDGRATRDGRLIAFFAVFLALPMVAGGAWLTPSLLDPETWTRRDFTLGTRLLSEARIVIDYIGWTLLPTPQGLSFYHDGFEVSRDLLHPWTTLTSILALAVLVWAMWAWRRSRPLAALGIGWYLGCHLLTGTVLPLELVYEHRNYFASIGLLLTVFALATETTDRLRISRPVGGLIVGLFIAWQAALTLITAQAWGDPLSLAQELALREPDSPRAQYELGRTYIIYSHYEAGSPFTKPAQEALERASRLPGSSTLPEQALIFMNSRMHLPVERKWWTSMARKLAAHPPTVQDESSLEALSSCLRQTSCDFAAQDLLDSYLAALGHPKPGARLLGMYANFAWNNLGDRSLGLRVQKQAVAASPGEAAYRIGLARMATVSGDFAEAHTQIDALQRMNIGGRLSHDIGALSTPLADAEHTKQVSQRAGEK
jgi:hypothetical protein